MCIIRPIRESGAKGSWLILLRKSVTALMVLGCVVTAISGCSSQADDRAAERDTAKEPGAEENEKEKTGENQDPPIAEETIKPFGGGPDKIITKQVSTTHNGVAAIGDYVRRRDFDEAAAQAFLDAYEIEYGEGWFSKTGYAKKTLEYLPEELSADGQLQNVTKTLQVSGNEAKALHLLAGVATLTGPTYSGTDMLGGSLLVAPDLMLLPSDYIHREIEEQVFARIHMRGAVDDLNPDFAPTKQNDAVSIFLTEATSRQFRFQGPQLNVSEARSISDEYVTYVVEVPYKGTKVRQHVQSKENMKLHFDKTEDDYLATGYKNVWTSLFPLGDDSGSSVTMSADGSSGLLVELPCRVPSVVVPLTIDDMTEPLSAKDMVELHGYGQHTCKPSDPKSLWLSGTSADPKVDYLKRSVEIIVRDDTSLAAQVFDQFCQHDEGGAILRDGKLYGYLSYFRPYLENTSETKISNQYYDADAHSAAITQARSSARINRVNDNAVDLARIVKEHTVDNDKPECAISEENRQSDFNPNVLARALDELAKEQATSEGPVEEKTAWVSLSDAATAACGGLLASNPAGTCASAVCAASTEQNPQCCGTGGFCTCPKSGTDGVWWIPAGSTCPPAADGIDTVTREENLSTLQRSAQLPHADSCFNLANLIANGHIVADSACPSVCEGSLFPQVQLDSPDAWADSTCAAWQHECITSHPSKCANELKLYP